MHMPPASAAQHKPQLSAKLNKDVPVHLFIPAGPKIDCSVRTAWVGVRIKIKNENNTTDGADDEIMH